MDGGGVWVLSKGPEQNTKQPLLSLKSTGGPVGAAGCFLFALYSRSRWSDLRCVYSYTADIVEIEGKITGYLEYVFGSTCLGGWENLLGFRIC